MASEFFNRTWTLFIDDKPFLKNTSARAITIEATVIVSVDSMNLLQLKIYGINNETMLSFKRDQKMRFDAGYDGSEGTLFDGIITIIEAGVEAPNTYVLLYGANFKFGKPGKPQRFVKNYQPKTAVSQIHKDIIEMMGFTYQNVNVPGSLVTGDYKVSLTGLPMRLLKSFNKSINKISNNKHQIGVIVGLDTIKTIDTAAKINDNKKPWQVNPKTGLLSVPTFRFTDMVSFQTALRPEIQLGDKVALQSYYWNYTDKNNPYLKPQTKTLGKAGSYLLWSITTTLNTNGQWVQNMIGTPVTWGDFSK